MSLAVHPLFLLHYLFILLQQPGLSSVIAAGDSASQAGKASFYHDRFHGQETSNGEYYDKGDFTAAHRNLPFNSIVLVTNKKTGRSAIVRINDRGPFVKSRIIDLSRAAANKLGMVPFGVVPVTIRQLSLFDRIPLSDSLMQDGEVWDVFGQKVELGSDYLQVWSTEHWKHAFYMATQISLEYHLSEVYILVDGPQEHRNYRVLTSEPPDPKERKALESKLRNDGFVQLKQWPGIRKP